MYSLKENNGKDGYVSLELNISTFYNALKNFIFFHKHGIHCEQLSWILPEFSIQIHSLLMQDTDYCSMVYL